MPKDISGAFTVLTGVLFKEIIISLTGIQNIQHAKIYCYEKTVL